MNKGRKFNLWTEEEVAILKEKYPTQGSNIPELLKARTINSIRDKAIVLNLDKVKIHCSWTDEEVAILKEKYPTQGPDIPELLKTHKSTKNIRAKANSLKIYKL